MMDKHNNLSIYWPVSLFFPYVSFSWSIRNLCSDEGAVLVGSSSDQNTASSLQIWIPVSMNFSSSVVFSSWPRGFQIRGSTYPFHYKKYSVTFVTLARGTRQFLSLLSRTRMDSHVKPTTCHILPSWGKILNIGSECSICTRGTLTEYIKMELTK